MYNKQIKTITIIGSHQAGVSPSGWSTKTICGRSKKHFAEDRKKRFVEGQKCRLLMTNTGTDN